MVHALREKLDAYEGLVENRAVAADLRGMLPGMLVEQVAAIFLENVNVFVMGFISTAAIAGVGQINTLNSVLMNVFQAFSIGGTALFAQHAGASRKSEASQTALSSLLLGLTVSAFLTGLLYLLHEDVVRMLFGGASRDVVENSITYFRYTVLILITNKNI